MRFSKVPERLPEQNLEPYDYTVSFFIYILLIWTEALFIQKVSIVYTSPFLDTDELVMALLARNLSGPFQKWAPVLKQPLKGF